MDEKLNAMTHGFGVLLATFGLFILIYAAHLYGGVWHLTSFTIYGISLILLYLASTLYHSFTKEKLKYIFKIIDHSAIYLLIAGTYTPFTLVPLHGLLGWIVFSIIWSLALIGVVLKIFFIKRFKVLSTICYLLMGWFMVVCIKPLIAALPPAGIWWLIAGGLFYTIGVVFYMARRLPYHHAIWHLFVLAGSTAHFITILYYVLPIQVI